MITLLDAISWVQSKEHIAASLGAHLGLTGSCLFKGESQKDADIICYPHKPDNPFDKAALVAALGLTITNRETFEKYADKDYGRCVTICNNDTGQRLDILFMT